MNCHIKGTNEIVRFDAGGILFLAELLSIFHEDFPHSKLFSYFCLHSGLFACLTMVTIVQLTTLWWMFNESCSIHMKRHIWIGITISKISHTSILTVKFLYLPFLLLVRLTENHVTNTWSQCCFNTIKEFFYRTGVQGLV